VPRLRRSDLVSGDLCWLLTIEYAGRTWRWSTRPVEIRTEAGEALPYDGGLPELEFEDTIELLSESPELRSISVTVVWPEDVAALIEAGYDLAAATGELALWVEGTVHERRLVLVSGALVEPEYGADGEEVSFSLEEPLSEDRGLIPEATAVVCATTMGGWAAARGYVGGTYDEEAEGLAYPVPFGEPGVYTDSTGATVTMGATPALLICALGGFATDVLISAYRVKATTVTIVDENGAMEVFPALYATDGLGRVVAYCHIQAAVTIDTTLTTFAVAWTNGPGIIGEDGQGIVDAGALILWLLARSTVPIDRGRCAVAAELLRGYVVAGYIDEPIAPTTWLVENLTSLYPITMASSEGGLYPAILRVDVRAEDCVDHLVAGPGIVRVSQVIYDRGRRDVVNAETLSWGWSSLADAYLRASRVSGSAASDPDAYQTPYAEISRLRYGEMPGEIIESDVIGDVGPALQALLWRARVYGFPTRLIDYEVDQTYAWLAAGDAILLTDAELHLDAQICSIRSVAYSDGGRIVLTLRIDEDPVRDGL